MPKPKNIPKKRVLEYLASLNNEVEANSSISAANSPNKRSSRTRGGVAKDQFVNENEGIEKQNADDSISQSDNKRKTTRSGSLRGKKRETEKPALEFNERINESKTAKNCSKLGEEGEAVVQSIVSNDNIEQIERHTRGTRKSRSFNKVEHSYDTKPSEDLSNLITGSITTSPSNLTNNQIEEVEKPSRVVKKRKSLVKNEPVYEQTPIIDESNLLIDSETAGPSKISNDTIEEVAKPNREVRKRNSFHQYEPIDDHTSTVGGLNLTVDGETAGPSSLSKDKVEEVDKHSRGVRKRKSISYKIEPGDDDSLFPFSDLEDEDDDKPYIPDVKKIINEEENSINKKIEKVKKRRSPVKRKSIEKVSKSALRKSPLIRDTVDSLNESFISNDEADEANITNPNNKKPGKGRKRSPAKKLEKSNEIFISNDDGDSSASCNKISNNEEVKSITNNEMDSLGEFDDTFVSNDGDESIISNPSSNEAKLNKESHVTKKSGEVNNEYLNAEEMATLGNLMGSPEHMASENTNIPLITNGNDEQLIESKSSSHKKISKRKGRPFGSKNKAKVSGISASIPGITKRKYTRKNLAPKKRVQKVKKEPTFSADGILIKKEPAEKKTKGRKRNTEGGIDENIDPLADDFFGNGRRRKKKGKRRRIGAPKTGSSINVTLPGVYDREVEEDEETEEEDLGKGGIVKRRKIRKHGEPYSVTGNWYIALGYLQDLNSLLKAWDKQPGMRYKVFAQCWCAKKFTLIYRGRQNFKELLEFSEELALLTKKFIVPPHTRKWRIGALFTLYGLFYKHPMRHFFKIRLTLDEYKLISDLVSPYRCDKDNPDPAYIFRKLEVEGAFFMTASSLEMCLDFHSAERESVNADYEAQRLAKTSSVTYALTSDSLLEDDELMQQYARIKQNSVGEVLQSAVNMVDVNMAATIQERMNELKQDSLVCLGLNEGAKEGSKHGISIKDALTIAQRRNIVRTKAMALNPKKIRGGLPCSQPSGTHQIIKKQKIQTDEMNIVEKRSGHISVSKTSKARAEILTDKTISSFMRPPSPVTLNKGLKKMGSQQPKVVTADLDVSQTEVEIGATGAAGVVSNRIELEVNNQAEEDENTVPDDGAIDNDMDPDDPSALYSTLLEDDWMSMPPPVQPPKRSRGRARKAVLMEAIKESQAAKPSTQSHRRMDDYKHLFTDGEDKTQLVQSLSSAVTINQRQIIDLPSDQTVMIPVKNEPIIGAANVALPGDNTIPINVIVEGEGRRITRKLLVKINYKQWEQIKSNEKRLNDLKGKLLPVVLRNLKFNKQINEAEWKVVDCYVNKPLNFEIMPAITPAIKTKVPESDRSRNNHSFNGSTNTVTGIQRKAKVIMKTIMVGNTIRHVPSYVTNEDLGYVEREATITVATTEKPESLGLSEFDPVGTQNVDYFSTHSPIKASVSKINYKGTSISVKGIDKKTNNIATSKDGHAFDYFNSNQQKQTHQNLATNIPSVPNQNPSYTILSSGQVVPQYWQPPPPGPTKVVPQDWQPPPPGPTSMELIKEWGEEECREEPPEDYQSRETEKESLEEAYAKDSQQNNPIWRANQKDRDDGQWKETGGNGIDDNIDHENNQSTIIANEMDKMSRGNNVSKSFSENLSPNVEECDNYSDHAGLDNDFDISDSDEEAEKDSERKEIPTQEIESVKRSPLSISIKKHCGVWEVKDPSPSISENNSKKSTFDVSQTSPRKKREIKFSVPFGEDSEIDNSKEKEQTESSPLRRSGRSSHGEKSNRQLIENETIGNPKSNEILGLSNSDSSSPRKRIRYSDDINESSMISNQNKTSENTNKPINDPQYSIDNPSNTTDSTMKGKRSSPIRGQRSRGRGTRGHGRGQKSGQIVQQNIDDDNPSDAYMDDCIQRDDSSEEDVPDIPKKIDLRKTNIVTDINTTPKHIEAKPGNDSEVNSIEDQEKFMEVFGLVSPHKSNKKKLGTDGRITPVPSADMEDPLGLNNTSDIEDSVNVNVRKILKEKLFSKDAGRILSTKELSVTPIAARNIVTSSDLPLTSTPNLASNARNHPLGGDGSSMVVPGLISIQGGSGNPLIVPQNSSGAILQGQKHGGINPLIPGQHGTIRHVKDVHGHKTAYYQPVPPQFVPQNNMRFQGQPSNLLGAQMRHRMVQPVSTNHLEQISPIPGALLGPNRLPLPSSITVSHLVRPAGHSSHLMQPMSLINPPSYRDIQQRVMQHAAIMSTVNQRPIQSATIAPRHHSMMMSQPNTIRDPSTMMPPPETLPPDTTSSKDKTKDKPGRSTPRADRFNPSTPQDIARMARVNDPKGTRLVKLRIDNETIWVPARNVVINPGDIKQEDSSAVTSQASSISTSSRDLLFPNDLKPDPASPGKVSVGAHYSDVASILSPGTLISNTQIKEYQKNISSSEIMDNKLDTKSAASHALNLTPSTFFDPKTQRTTVNITMEQINSLMKGKIDEKLKEQVGTIMTDREISTPKIQRNTQESTTSSTASSSSTSSTSTTSSNQLSHSSPKPRGGVCSFTFGKKPAKPIRPSTPTTPVNTSVTKPKPKTPVCSFLFGPKYKMMSKLKETIGEATGKAAKPTPVKKRNVSFLLMKPLAKKKN